MDKIYQQELLADIKKNLVRAPLQPIQSTSTNPHPAGTPTKKGKTKDEKRTILFPETMASTYKQSFITQKKWARRICIGRFTSSFLCLRHKAINYRWWAVTDRKHPSIILSLRYHRNCIINLYNYAEYKRKKHLQVLMLPSVLPHD